MQSQQGGEAFRRARDGGRDAITALLGAWCKPVQLFSAVFVASFDDVIAAQPRLWRVVRQRLPGYPDDAQPETWLCHQLAGEMEHIIAAAGPPEDALRQRLAEQGARLLRQDYLAACTIGSGIARRVAALDGRGHELVSRRYRGRAGPVTRDAAVRLLELRAVLDWQADGARPPPDSDPRFPQLLEDVLGGCGDAGAGRRLLAALVEDPRLGAVYDRQARLDLVLRTWFAPSGPLECAVLLHQLVWDNDDSSRLSPAVIQARRRAGGVSLLGPPAARPQQPRPLGPPPARPATIRQAPRPSASGWNAAVLIAAICILLGLLGALLLHLGHPSP